MDHSPPSPPLYLVISSGNNTHQLRGVDNIRWMDHIYCLKSNFNRISQTSVNFGISLYLLIHAYVCCVCIVFIEEEESYCGDERCPTSQGKSDLVLIASRYGSPVGRRLPCARLEFIIEVGPRLCLLEHGKICMWRQGVQAGDVSFSPSTFNHRRLHLIIRPSSLGRTVWMHDANSQKRLYRSPDLLPA